MVLYLAVVHEYEIILVILNDGILLINIKFVDKYHS
jgi:hypothetical protein